MLKPLLRSFLTPAFFMPQELNMMMPAMIAIAARFDAFNFDGAISVDIGKWLFSLVNSQAACIIDREPKAMDANTASPEKGIFPSIEFPLNRECSIWAIL